MKKTWYTSLTIAALLILSCSGSGLEDIFVPNLSNNWQNINERTNEFFFLPEQTDVNKSRFDGNENTTGGDQFQFEGSFENASIEFTYLSGPRKDKTYKGNFDPKSNPLRMMVKSGSETLVLERQP
jgi:hypothetical protein